VIEEGRRLLAFAVPDATARAVRFVSGARSSA
jgi:hypothetical protein